MKKTDIDKIRDGMAQGSGDAAFETDDGRTYNISGAASVLQRLFKQVQNYGLLFPEDFPDTREDNNPDSAGVTSDVNLVSEQEVREAQKAMQYFEDELATLMSTFAGNDGTLEDENGNQVADLPNAATTTTKNAEVPDVSSN